MMKPNIWIALLLTMVLSACGGSDVVVESDGASGGASDGTSSGNTGGNTGEETDNDEAIPQVLQVGSGSGVGFEPGKVTFLSVSEDSTDIDVSVTVTDKNNANAEVAGNYRAEFSSTCLTPVNGTDAVVQSDSTLTKRYKNEASCASDTIDVTVYQFSDNTAVGTASGTINSSSPSAETPEPVLGYGSGAAFREAQINAEALSVVVGDSLALSISAVDKKKGNALLTGAYSYKFESACETAGSANFTSKTSLLASGVGTTEFLNLNCTGTDTITAYLFAPGIDTTDNSAAVDTATLVIDVTLPKLGSGTGAAFIVDQIAGADTLEDSGSVELSANVVNPLNNNSAVASTSYKAIWSSSCLDADFTVTEQNLTGSDIRTRYSTDESNCPGVNTITLNLYDRSDLSTALATATKNIEVVASGAGSVLQVGSGSGVGFEPGKVTFLSVSEDSTDIDVSVTVTDKNNANAEVAGNYRAEFSATCLTPVNGTDAVVQSDSTLTKRYKNEASCASDTIDVTVYQFSDNTAVGTASGTINSSSPSAETPEPVLGYGSGAAFREAQINAEALSVVVGDSLALSISAVDKKKGNALLTGAYSYKFESACETAGSANFTSKTSLLASGVGTTEFLNLNCTGTDTITAYLFAPGIDTTDNSAAVDTATLVIDVTLPKLGSGTGAAFIVDQIAGADTLEDSGSVELSANVVNPLNNNSAVTSTSYKAIWSSSCVDADFTVTEQNLTGSDIRTRYSTDESNCPGVNTITLNLYDRSDLSTPLATATKNIEVVASGAGSVLQVGSGSGVGFEPGKVTFLSVSEDSTDIDVSVTVTDKNNANAEVAGNYRAEFSATCLTPVNGTDAVVQSDSTLTKRYKNEASCASDTIDVTVYQFSDNTAVGTASGTINSSSPSVETPVPALGYGSGASFREGVISADAFAIVAGSSLSVSITAVDKNKGNALLSGSYRYKFSSACESSGNAVFSSTSSLLSGGVGAADYINIDCTGTDTITAYLFAPGADASNNANALDSATLTIRTALPKLGSGSGADFIENRISGADSLEGSDSIELTASVVNPLNNNGVISDANYEVKWSTSCASADFTLPEQTLATEIRTRYFGDTANCLGTDTITLELYERTNPTVILATATKDIAVSLGVDAKLGFGAGLGFSESTLNITPAVLAAGGTALITANIVDGNNADALVSNKAYGVTISSDCAVQGQAAFTESEKIVFQGEARFSYTAQGCVDADALTVSLYAVTDGVIDQTRLLKTATGTITVNKAEIGAILSDVISSQQLSVTSVANPLLPTQAQVSFKVVDKNGDPVADQEVRFSLSSDVGGISLTSPTAITDSDGLVTALVNSGSTHAITSVIAETTTDTGDLLRTSSLPISITTGLPRQDRFSIAVDVFNPAAYNFDGTEVTVTASAADAFGNPVPDGTIVNFSTESGMVVSSCSTTSGRCSAVWTSSGKRPGQFDPSLNRVNERVGFTTIVAYTEGEAGFTDSNGNYMLDANESFISFDEVFQDENWDLTLNQDAGSNNVEPFFDFNQDGLWSAAPATYQGAACSDAMRGLGHCAERMHVRGITRIVQSMKDSITMRFFSCSAGSCSEDVAPPVLVPTNGSFYVVLQDGNGNIPASGSTFEATGDGYDVVADKGGVPNSIGLLTQDNPSLAGMTGLPEYGALYQVSYTPEAQAKLIEVTAVSGEKTVTIKLYP